MESGRGRCFPDGKLQQVPNKTEMGNSVMRVPAAGVSHAGQRMISDLFHRNGGWSFNAIFNLKGNKIILFNRR